ncbi:MAG: Ribonuclease PH [Actinobacteria bacterium ADurb.Bin444]|nr:MAG: Ribonuclease PH [Actinobacteria bacterium ADurb.Bin444]
MATEPQGQHTGPSSESRVGRRGPREIRPLGVTPGFLGSAQGSVLLELGRTRVLCAANLVDGVPGWRRGSREGWLTAEYSLLPSSTQERTPREAVRGRQDGRTVEIQRLIGRSLRTVTDLGALGERTLYVDCDVIEADGGTRCAAVSGGYLALHLALKKAVDEGRLRSLPLTDSVAAVSVGVVGGMPVLDLEYAEDSAADVDMNVVMTGSGRIIEVQATAEIVPFSRDTLEQLLDLAEEGLKEISAVQAEVIASVYRAQNHRVG